MPTDTSAGPRLIPTRTPDTLAWVRTDLAARLLPFAVVVAAVQAVRSPRWLGWSLGDVQAQLIFGVLGGSLLFGAACAVQLLLARRRGALRMPADASDLLLQGAYYWLNAPLEEAFFRGLLQGGVAALTTPLLALPLATAAYVLYHRLGGWAWADVWATALLGVPLAIAFWLLPGPPSLLGVSLAHACATCGFLGPGPALLHRLRLL